LAHVAGWFRALYETTGINLTIFYDPFDRARFAEGLLTTLELSGICIVVSVAIGVVGAWLQRSRAGSAKAIIELYIQVFRNTPPLIQLYFLYFAVGPHITTRLANGSIEPLVGSFVWAAICFSVYAGAFNIEIFRAGIEAIPSATIEAADVLGLRRLQIYRLVILPLAFRISLPALNNNLVNLIKLTTVAYAIGVPELLYVSSQIWSDAINVPEMMNVLLIVYVSLVGLFIFTMTRLEDALRIPGIGQ
jgi:polar amino acid transport system permease protein